MSYGAVLGQSLDSSPVLNNYYTKNETLTEETAQLYGLDQNAVPNDVFNSIASGTTNSLVLTGTVIWYAGTSAPNGFLICNGSNVSRETYSNLFFVIGTRFGNGDGSTTFTLPNLINEFIKGGTNTGATNPGTAIWKYDSAGIAGLNIINPISTQSQNFSTNSYSSGSSVSLSGTYNYVQPPNVTLLPCIKY